MDYLTLKMLHILGAIIFTGNITVTALWKVMADRQRDPRIVAFAQSLVTLTDFVFTATGAALIAATGIAMAINFNEEFWRVPWILHGIILFGISGILWAAFLIPIQVKQARLAKNFQHDGDIPPEFWRLGRLWMLFGIPATILPYVNLYFMVFRPA
ncbi:MAG TPA: DUF2269 domain-containing protein [Chitinophagales bacterium]|nr:DUF2269 domain-containing protein [Chitinophagales bacterium]